MIYYLDKLVAILERPIADACYAVAYHNTRKACAIIERFKADACDTVSYYYACNIISVI